MRGAIILRNSSGVCTLLSTLNNIRIVLVNTFHPGNIGSSARALKTMGMNQLYLVSPRDFPHEDANRLAASADDVLQNAVVVETLYEAVADCKMVIISTVRERGYDLPVLTPEKCAGQLLESSKQGPVALVFGPERFGISNEDLSLGKYRVTIPANPEYSSLNLAASVQTLSYEVYKQQTQGSSENAAPDTREQVSLKDMERFFEHLESTYQSTGFINSKHPGEVIKRLRQLFARAQPDQMEMNILRGMLASVDKIVDQKDKSER